MFTVGLDDTDTLDHPGTNQLARHLVASIRDGFCGTLVLRHQLLQDPRVPCTRKNGCATILFTADSHRSRQELIAELRQRILVWCPVGSDPGFCVAEVVPDEIIAFGLRCQTELVTQAEARALAQKHGIYLEGLGGTEDGVIGALAAVGLWATHNSGRVIYRANSGGDLYDVSGCQPLESLASYGIEAVLHHDSGEPVTAGAVDLGKRLRPNYRDGRIVLFIANPDAETAPDARAPFV